MWKEAERDYPVQVKAASRRRDEGRDAFTEEQLREAVGMLDALRAKKMQPDRCRGDLSGSAPAIVADGELTGVVNDERRTDKEYAVQAEAARPACERLVMPSAATTARQTDPFALLCITQLPSVVTVVLHSANLQLRRLRLSGTEHAGFAAFQQAASLPCFVSTDGTRHLFGLYAEYGVVCTLRPADWVLEHYCFIGSRSCVRS